MGCKSCEKDAISIYKEISEVTGQRFFSYHNENNNQIILSLEAIDILQSQGKLPLDTELTPI